MFKKIHKVRVLRAEAMELVKVLGKYGVKFEVSDEYPDNSNGQRVWYRNITIRTTTRTMKKIQTEFETAENR